MMVLVQTEKVLALGEEQVTVLTLVQLSAQWVLDADAEAVGKVGVSIAIKEIPGCKIRSMN